MNVTLTFSTLQEKVSRSLSIIGKRAKDENGKLLFEDITLGSREQELILDYLRQAIIDLSAELAAKITGVTDGTLLTTKTITLTFPDNYNSSLDQFIIQSCNEYCVSYALYSWFTVTMPTLAEKYLADCTRQMGVLHRITHEKRQPTQSSQTYEDVNGEVVVPEPETPDADDPNNPSRPNDDFDDDE